MPGTIEDVRPATPADEVIREPSPLAGAALWGKLLARRRPLIFVPIFVAAALVALLKPSPPPLPVAMGAAAVAILAYVARVWATGYRSWVGSGGSRHLMLAGPYARLRHPLYVANGIKGAAALVEVGRFEILAVYSLVYVVVIACIVAREEQALEERYGEAHAGYRAQVPGFLPSPWRSLAMPERRGQFSWRPVVSGREGWKLLSATALLVFFLIWR